MRIEEDIFKFTKVYRLIYNVSEEIYSNGHLSNVFSRNSLNRMLLWGCE